MKLLYTLTAYPPSTGGAQFLQHQLAQQLISRHSIQVVSQWDTNRTDWLRGTTLGAPSASYDYTIDGIPVHRLGLSSWEKLCMVPYLPIYYPWMTMALRPLATALERHLYSLAQHVDLVHNVRIGREPLSYASFQLAQRCDVPFVLTPLHHPRWTGWRYRAYNKLYTLADAVLALTCTEKETLEAIGVPENRIFVTGMGPVLAPQSDPAAFRQQLQVDGPIVLFLGQHYQYKGYRELLAAANLVWEKVPDVHFVFIGPGVRQSDRDFARITDKRIHRLGKVALQEKTNALAACSLLCVPSTQESFGGVYTEAWSFGKPVIGCSIPAVSEVITDEVNGYLVAQRPPEIAERICHLILNPSVAQALGLAGQRKVETTFTWQQIADRTERAYSAVLGRRDDEVSGEQK